MGEMNWQEAEDPAVSHMRMSGFPDAQKTAGGADRGIDVVAVRAVAQVKLLGQPVGSPDIQRFKGAAHDSRNALFYSSSGYSRAAVSIADQLGIALFTFSPVTRDVVATNDHAKYLRRPDMMESLAPEQAAEIAEGIQELSRLHSQATIVILAFGDLLEDAQMGRSKRWDGMQRDIDSLRPLIDPFRVGARAANELIQQLEPAEAVRTMRQANGLIMSWFAGARCNNESFVPYRRAATEHYRRSAGETPTD